MTVNNKKREKPNIKLSGYCIYCNISFNLPKDENLNNIRCPKCGTLEIMFEIEENEYLDYYT